jgi:uncharacterized protein YkwD
MRNTIWLLIVLAGTAGGESSLTREMLAAHNAERARVGVPPIHWSDQLAAIAQDWADTLLSRQQFVHRPNSPYGENLFEIRGSGASPTRVVGLWAAESRNYDYRSNRCNGVCGHYTQIVWRDTKEVGCAVARADAQEVWVCNYNPPGNWVGKRPY